MRFCFSSRALFRLRPPTQQPFEVGSGDCCGLVRVGVAFRALFSLPRFFGANDDDIPPVFTPPRQVESQVTVVPAGEATVLQSAIRMFLEKPEKTHGHCSEQDAPEKTPGCCSVTVVSKIGQLEAEEQTRERTMR